MARAARASSTFWIDHGVTIFRVDNPHTKPFRVLGVGDRARSSAQHPDVIFLAEAFTRPKVMRRLAKLGFTQSYTYFTWRNTQARADRVLHRADADRRSREYLRPNLFAEHARHPARVPAARRPAGVQVAARARRDARRELRHLQRLRAVRERAGAGRAARSTSTRRSTRSGSWDCDAARQPRRPDRARQPRSAASTRRCSATAGLRFHPTDNPQLLCYSKRSRRRHRSACSSSSTSTRTTCSTGCVDAAARRLRARDRRSRSRSHDLLSDERYLWRGARNYVAPRSRQHAPAHMFCVVRRCARARLRLLPLSRQRDDARPRTGRHADPALVQGRGHLPGARPCVLRQQRRRHRRLPGPDAEARLPAGPRRQLRSGCCRSTPRRCATTATTSPTTANVHPSYGTLDDFERFVDEAHRRGLRVITELVINHTSDQHPWFQAARRAPAGSPERDFYVWSDTDQKYRRRRGSSSPTPRRRTGRWDAGRQGSTTGTASSATSRISTSTTRRCSTR